MSQDPDNAPDAVLTDTIHAVGYRRLPEQRRRRPIWAIARTLISLSLKRRITKLALIMCLMVLVGHGIWLAVQLMGERFAAEGGFNMSGFGIRDTVGHVEEVISAYLRVQFYFTVPTIAVMAGGAVADDRHAGAFELYFSRPLTRLDYCFGKLLGAAIVPGVTLILATMVLWLAAVGIAPDTLRGDLWHIGLPALAGATLGTVLLASLIVGLSAVSKRARNVGVAFVTLMLVVGGIAEGMAESGYAWGGYLSPERDLSTVVHAMLDVGTSSMANSFLTQGSHFNTDVSTSAIALGGYVLLGLSALWISLSREVKA